MHTTPCRVHWLHLIAIDNVYQTMRIELNNLELVKHTFFHILERGQRIKGAFAWPMKLSPFVLLSVPFTSAQCPNKCSRNGICNNKGACECISSFIGADCSQRICPKGKSFSDMPLSQDVAHLEITCSGRGVCKNGECDCDDGFTGIACERSELFCCLFLFVFFV